MSYLALPLFAAIALTSFGCVVLTWGHSRRPNRLAAFLLFGAAWWSICQVLWNAAPDATTALWLNRLSAPGWVFVAPLAVHMVLELTEVPAPLMRRLLPALYAGAWTFLALAMATPLMIEDVERTTWGWGLVPGPLFGGYYVFTMVGVGCGLVSWIRGYRQSRSHIDRRRGPLLALSMGVPITGASLSEAVLPLLGHQPPRLGTACFAVLGATVLWSMHRFGYSLLAPEGFARRILRTLPDGVAFVSMNGHIRTANRQMAGLLGCSIDEAIGLPIDRHLSHPILEPPFEVDLVECELRPLDDRPVPVSISTAPLLDNMEDPIGVVVIARDTREVTALRNRLVTSGRLAAVGQLAAGIAHEINNPLAFVRSNLSLLRREWEGIADQLHKLRDGEGGPLPPLGEVLGDWEELLDESLEGVDRAVTIVRDVKEFSHAGSGEQEPADLNQLLDHALRVATPQLSAGVSVERRYEALPPVVCAPQRLRQLFLNLIVNAAQAIEGRGTVRVRTEHRGGDVIVTIQDDGCGIPHDVMERIFDPFFTTKPVGLGTGLGLSISYEIVRSHAGEIQAESEPGVGTSLRVRLPVGGRDARHRPTARAQRERNS